MSDELKSHYEKVLEIRDEAAAKLIKMKNDYIASGNVDEFMIEMYDEQISFIQKSVKDMKKVIS